MPRHKRTYTPEQKERILETFFRAMAVDWSMVRFARVSGVSRQTVFHWLQEDASFSRYRRAMETKAFTLPHRADDVVKRLLGGKLEAKVAGVVLRHLEFRLMREFKGGVYQTQKTIKHKAAVSDMTDEQLEERFEELRRKAVIEKDLDK